MRLLGLTQRMRPPTARAARWPGGWRPLHPAQGLPRGLRRAGGCPHFQESWI